MKHTATRRPLCNPRACYRTRIITFLTFTLLAQKLISNFDVGSAMTSMARSVQLHASQRSIEKVMVHIYFYNKDNIKLYIMEK